MPNLFKTGCFNVQACEEISNILLMISTLILLTTKDIVFIMSILLNLWSLTQGPEYDLPWELVCVSEN